MRGLLLLFLVPALAAIAAQAPPPADTLFADGDFSGAKTTYARAARDNPKYVAAILGFGRMALYGNDLDSAAKSASDALTLDPRNEAAKHLLAGIAERRGILASAAALKVPDAGVVLPFVESEPLPLLALNIDGRPANLVLDTGASDVTLDPDFAKELGLKISGGRMGVFAGGRNAQMQEATAHSVEAGPIVLREIKVSILPTRKVSVFKTARIDGFIGTVFLSRFLATIDYPGHRLVLRPRTSAAVREMPATTVPIWLIGDHFVFAHGSVNGLKDQLFLVDSGGAGVGFMPEKATIDAAHIRTFPDRAQQGVGGGGTVTAIPIEAYKVCLGAVCRSPVPGLYTPQGSPLKMFPFHVAGVVSHLFLEHYRVTFDFVHMQLVLANP